MIIAGLEEKERSKGLQTRKADGNKADEKEIWKQIDCWIGRSQRGE